jgi:hypothetical protein
MKFSNVSLLTLIIVAVASSNTPLTKDACIDCHRQLDEEQDVGEQILKNVFQDIHLQVGLSCADCHGGNPEAYDDEDEAMWDNPTFKGAISRRDQPEICGSCHSDPQFMRQYSASVQTDQVDQYWTSQHGKDLLNGNEKVATCTNCHGVHGIYPVKDPRSSVYPLNVPSTCAQCHNDAEYMSEFGIPTDQYYLYRTSVHGKALLDRQSITAPACNDCHGNHGALPPDVVHIADICGTCHVNNSQLFQKSHLNNIFLKKGFGQCEACHGNHGVKKPSDEYFNWEHGAVWLQCHGNTTGNPKELADLFYHTIDSLKGQISQAEDLMGRAEQKGMEISDLYFPLEKSQKVLIQTRTSIHSFNKDLLLETVEDGFIASDEAIQGASLALTEFDQRRKWLFIFSLIITYLIVVVYFKIKDFDRRDRNKNK